MSRLSLIILLLSPTTLLGQTGAIVPGPNLVVEGVPRIPLALAEKVGRYTEFRSAHREDWHPERREMLISTRFGETAQIHHVKTPGGARMQLTFFPDSVPSASFPPKGGDEFIFSKALGGNERYQLYRYDLATGDVTLLTDGKSRNGGVVWSNKGDRIAYASTRRTGADTDVYVMDPRDPKSDRLLLQLKGGGWMPLDWSTLDSKLLVGEYLSINETNHWLVDTQSGQKSLLTPRGKEKVFHGVGHFSRDGKGIYFPSDQDSEFKRLLYRDLASKKITVVADLKWDIESFALSRDGKWLAYVANEDGQGVLHLFDLASREEKPLKLPPGSVSGIAWHNDSRNLGFNLVSARTPSDVYSVDVVSGKVERWTSSETGGLNTQNFVLPELIRWESFDKRTISGYLYSPPAKFKGKRPVVIDIHGGPESQFRPGFLARKNYLLNEMGIALIFPNIRGSSGYGKTFLTLDNGFLREDAYKDIGALLDWIGKRPDLDAERLMVTGGSYGGHMTLAVATYYPERIRCAVDVVGPSNLVSLLENTESYRRDLRRAEYGDEREPKMRAFMEKIAPLNNAHKIIKPLFVVQGKNDPRVPLSESEQIVRAVRQAGTPIWYLMAADEGHGFAKKKNADVQFYATLLFIEEFLLGDAKTQPGPAVTPPQAVANLLAGFRRGDFKLILDQFAEPSRTVQEIQIEGMRKQAELEALIEAKFAKKKEALKPPTLQQLMQNVRDLEVVHQEEGGRDAVKLTVWQADDQAGKEVISEYTWLAVKENGVWKLQLPPGGGVAAREVRIGPGGEKLDVFVVLSEPKHDPKDVEYMKKTWPKFQMLLKEMSEQVKAGKFKSREEARTAYQKAVAAFTALNPPPLRETPKIKKKEKS